MMNLRKFLPIATLFFALILTIVSCDKDNLDLNSEAHSVEETTLASRGYLALVDTQNNQESTTEVEEDSCFTINYPVTILFPGDVSQDVNTEEELDDAIDTWFDANQDAEDYPTLQFPISVTLADGTTQSIGDDEELCDLFFDCYGDEDWDDEDWDDEDWDEEDLDFTDCFTISYPISVSTSETGTVSINSDEELDAFFLSLENTDIDDEDVVFTFPIDVVLNEDGTSITINNDEELEDLFVDCFGDDYDDEDWDDEDEGFEDCFTIVYPVSITTSAGTITINNDEELDAFFENLEDSGADEEDVEFVFPIDVIWLEDSSTVMLTTEEELDELLFACFGEDYDDEDFGDCDDVDDFEDCFTFVYPFDVSVAGTITSINSDEELDEIFDDIEHEDDLELVYPINVTLTDDESVVAVNSDEDLEAIWDACE